MAKQTHSEQYERVRRDFDDLSIQDRAVFLIEATVTTIARGVERAGQTLADELDNAFRWKAEPAAEGAGPAAEPPPSSTTGSSRRRSGPGAASPEGHVET